MTRRPLALAVLAASLLLLAAPARAEEPQAPPKPVPSRASDEEAAAALQAFKEAWKAKGLRGDERTAARELAMRKLAVVQHPLVVERLAKLTRERDADLRTLAALYLGEQRALPGLAGKALVKAIQANLDDPVFVMFGLESLAGVDYRGAVDTFLALLSHKDDGVQKVTMLMIGDMKEMRLLDAMIQRMHELKIDKGAKWEGGEVHYDTGAEGTHDQEMAESIWNEKYGGNARRGRSAARAMRDMRPVILDAMKRLTGQQFSTTTEARAWAEANAAEVKTLQEDLTRQASEQDAATRAR